MHYVYYFILPNCLYICNIYSLGIQINFTCIKLNDTGHETTDWFQIGKGVCQGCILSPCLFNLYEEYIVRNAWLDEAEVGIKISGRNINNLRYADDTTLMAESEEELKSLFMKVKEEWKSWVKAQHSENEDHGIWLHHFMEIDGETVETVSDFIFGGLQNHCRWWLQPWN